MCDNKKNACCTHHVLLDGDGIDAPSLRKPSWTPRPPLVLRRQYLLSSTVEIYIAGRKHRGRTCRNGPFATLRNAVRIGVIVGVRGADEKNRVRVGVLEEMLLVDVLDVGRVLRLTLAKPAPHRSTCSSEITGASTGACGIIGVSMGACEITCASTGACEIMGASAGAYEITGASTDACEIRGATTGTCEICSSSFAMSCLTEMCCMVEM